MITYSQLKEKFLDKGYLWEFYTFVGSIPNPDFSRLIISPEETPKDVIKRFHDLWIKSRQQEWDYWNTWIDYQNYK